MFTLINILARTCTPRQNAASTEIETLVITCNGEKLVGFTSCAYACSMQVAHAYFIVKRKCFSKLCKLRSLSVKLQYNEDAGIHKWFRKTGKALGLWATAKDILVCALNLEIHKHRFWKIAQFAKSQVVVTDSVLSSSSINQKLLPKWFSMVAVVYYIAYLCSQSCDLLIQVKLFLYHYVPLRARKQDGLTSSCIVLSI